MKRQCSNCNNYGHNSRTCPSRTSGGGGGAVRLFGVSLTDGSIMKKSASTGNLSSLQHMSSGSSPVPGSTPADQANIPGGYLSDDPAHASSSVNRRLERKKGIPWTVDEHRQFLLGLQKLGRGDWCGISKSYVQSRTPTQVASHAQKYFIRQSKETARKRRSSLFDMDANTPPQQEEPLGLPPQSGASYKVQTGSFSGEAEDDNPSTRISLDLSLKPNLESIDITPTEGAKETKSTPPTPSPPSVPPMFPSVVPAYVPLPFPFTLPFVQGVETTSQHQIFQAIPVFANGPINVNEFIGMSQLSLSSTAPRNIESLPPPLSLNLTIEPPLH